MTAWTPERREQARALMARQNRDPDFVAKKCAWQRDPTRRPAMVARGQAVAASRTHDPEVNAKWRIGVARANAKPAKRAQSAAVMQALRQRPDVQSKVRAHVTVMVRDPAVQARRVETRKLGPLPKGFRGRYQQLRALVGAKVAIGIVRQEAAVAAGSVP